MFPKGKIPQSDMQSLAQQATVRQAGLFINLARDPMSKLTRNGMQLVSERIDPLSYGGRWENLAVDFETITVTSWGEALTYRYSGDKAFLDCLCDYFAWSPVDSGKVPPPLPCFSFSSSRGAFIARRLEQLISEITEYFYYNYWRRHARYALRIGQNYYVLKCEHNIPRYQELDSLTALLNHLGQPQVAFSPIRIDKQTTENSPLALVLERNREGVIQLFYQLSSGRAQVYILDERGSLFHQRLVCHDWQMLVGQFQHFLDMVRYRLNNTNMPNSLSDKTGFQYFQIGRNSLGEYVLEPVKANPESVTGRHLDVQVIGSLEDERHGSFSIFCGNREFSALEFGDQIFQRAAEHISRERGRDQDFPFYITDIDLNPAMLGTDTVNGVQSIHFLNYKKRIETLLNLALQNRQM
jgi:adenylate cyclase class 1